MNKVINFGAGPAKVPEEVLNKVSSELFDYNGLGISLMESSHRCSTYMKLNDNINDLVRKLLNVPNNYKILFMAGGGQGQFAAVPMNLMGRTGTADYVVTGSWSQLAANEAKKYGKVNTIPIEPKVPFVDIPDQSTWNLDPNASYVHICCNETIHGVEFDFTPDTKGVPLVADMSSNIMSREFDVSKYGVIYATAQKNIGISGSTLVIVREDLLKNPLPITPTVLDWTKHADSKSILNTPPVFAIYVMGEVFRWIEKKGGVKEMSKQAERKSKLIYGIIDESAGFYVCPVKEKARSRMNVPFRIKSINGDKELEETFLKGAEERHLIQLKGHRSVGGIRASLYNALTFEEAEVLAKYMKEFQQKYSM